VVPLPNGNPLSQPTLSLSLIHKSVTLSMCIADRATGVPRTDPDDRDVIRKSVTFSESPLPYPQVRYLIHKSCTLSTSPVPYPCVLQIERPEFLARIRMSVTLSKSPLPYPQVCYLIPVYGRSSDRSSSPGSGRWIRRSPADRL